MLVAVRVRTIGQVGVVVAIPAVGVVVAIPAVDISTASVAGVPSG
jgi:hypothetical protein